MTVAANETAARQNLKAEGMIDPRKLTQSAMSFMYFSRVNVLKQKKPRTIRIMMNRKAAEEYHITLSDTPERSTLVGRRQ
ncbi:unnamed protein product [Macrosiphum euphorbiae]|uniref:Uncharacterized protein n=1 Tax=Macrosiphum euphorbiae TaxID=13131 RepID=A0AAV0VRN9_9HEMI|nr:unnamed protein product [Macrosiphum euphorbiae]